MIYIQHDFYSNFTNSVNYGDSEFALDILKSELSDLIVYNFEEIIELFKKANLSISAKRSDQDILHKIVENIKVNDKFNRGLAFLMIKNNEGSDDNKKVLENTKKLSLHLSKLGKEFIEKPRNQVAFEKDTLDMIEMKSNVKGDRNRKVRSSDNTFWWLLAIIGVGFAGYFIYKYFQNKKDEELRRLSLEPKLNSGGEISNELSIPSNGVDGSVSVNNSVDGNVSAVNQPVVDPRVNHPAYNVGTDVLIPANNIPQNNLNTNNSPNPSDIAQQQSVANSMSNLNFSQQQIHNSGISKNIVPVNTQNAVNNAHVSNNSNQQNVNI